MIDTREHEELIQRLFKEHGLSSDRYEIVDSILDWCNENGIEERNNNRAAKCLCRSKDGSYYILFAAKQTDEMIKSGMDYMILNGFSDEVSKLDTQLKYFEHLVLHEIACPVLKDTGQMSRDKWAFEQMA